MCSLKVAEYIVCTTTMQYKFIIIFIPLKIAIFLITYFKSYEC